MIVGLATLLMTILIVGTILDVPKAMVKAKGNPLNDMGKVGVGALAAKEVYDLITKNNRSGFGSPNRSDPDYGERPY